MAKREPINTALVCWIPTPDDYHFIPTVHLDPAYVVGVNAQFPVFTAGDGPVYRRQTQQYIAKQEFEKRKAEGEHLYPQPEYRRRSFAITDRRVFHFGAVYIHVHRNVAESNECSAYGHIYSVINEDHASDVDDVEIEFSTNIDPRGTTTLPLAVIP